MTTTFATLPVGPFDVDTERRTITGLALPYGQRARQGGRAIRFEVGAVGWTDVTRVKLLRDHDSGQAVGHAVALENRPEGLWARFKVAPGPEGDRALELAQHRVADGLSVGVDFEDDDFTIDADGTMAVHRAVVREVSLTPMPAFDNARVHHVAASRTAGGHVPDNTTTTTTAPEPAPAAPVEEPRFTLQQFAQLRGLFADQQPAATPEPVEGPIAVNPTRPVPGDRQREPEDLWGPAGPPPLMLSREQIAEFAQAVNERRPIRLVADGPRETFAAVTTAGTGREKRHIGGRAGLNPLRIAELVGIPTDNVGRGGEAAYPLFGAGAAATAAEGVAKAEYDNVSPGTATPQVIAVWTDQTDQVQSLPNFEQKLRMKQARLIAVRENELLRATVAGTAGINTQAFTSGDQAVQILRAGAGIEAANGVRPDLMLFNPADTAAIFGTSVANAAPQEIAELSVQVFGMVGLPMSTQPAGFVLVGAWAAAATLVVGNPVTWMTDPYTQMKNNIITLLAEESVALAVEEPTAFTNVDIVTP